MGKKAASYVKLHHCTLTSEPKEYVVFFIVDSVKCYVYASSDSKDECQSINFPDAFFSVFMLYSDVFGLLFSFEPSCFFV